MQGNKDAGGLFEKVLLLRLLLIDVSGSLETVDNIIVILRTKQYDNNTSLSFSPGTNHWYNKRLH